MIEPDERTDEVAAQVVDAAIEVHRHLGPGLLEDHYKDALALELRLRGLDVVREVPVAVAYKGHALGRDYRLDMLVGDAVVVEVKALRALLPVHISQLVSYVRMTGQQVGLLLNFHERRMVDGITRVANSHALAALRGDTR